jgi:hypothetical protein
MNKLFDNAKPVLATIVIFVLMFLLFASRDARADSELTFDVGSAMVRGYTPTIGLNVRWPEAGPGRMDWEAGFHLSGQSTNKQENPNAFTLYGMLVPNWGPVELGLGFAYTNTPWEYTCQETAALMAGYRYKRVTLRWYHYSSAGSCKPNAGRDFLKLGWRF